MINFLHKPGNALENGGRKNSEFRSEASDNIEICPSCRKEILISEVIRNYNCCPECGRHFKTGSRKKITMIVDKNSFDELFADMESVNFLEFPGYDKKLQTAKEKSREKESVICGTALISGRPVAVFSMDSDFMMGSMGTVTGEKITRLFEYATERKLPVIGWILSGGARMQEGILSLMQMAKTSAAVRRHSEKGLLYIAVLTNPTTGGVSASFAMEADITLAEPAAVIGFAGARVIEQAAGRKLPKGFQRAEFMLEHGFIDRIVPRSEQKETLSLLLKMHETGGGSDE